MTIQQAVRKTRETLSAAGIEPAAFEARQLAAYCFSLPVSSLLLRGGDNAEPAALSRLDVLAARRAAGEPLQYILGEWEFLGLPFSVGEGVLIPRPDTELLAETALSLIPADRPCEILELCAGSGCIAVTLVLNRPACRITALEKSEAAYSYLARNIDRHNTPHVRPILGDLTLGPDAVLQPGDRFDLILSNPPYIPADDIPSLSREVSAEPRMALDGGPDGLLFYRAICKRWLSRLLPGGRLAVEIGIGQAEAVEEIFSEAGLKEVRALRDLGGIERVIIGTLEDMPY